MKARLTPRVRDAISRECRTSNDRESCGFLLGHRTGGVFEITELFAARNLSPSGGRFSISPVDCRRAKRFAEAEGLLVAAVFHTHPSGITSLSREDERGLARSDLPWCVVAIAGDRLKARVFSVKSDQTEEWEVVPNEWPIARRGREGVSKRAHPPDARG